MKPIAIFRHAETEGPGYLGEFLTSRHIAWQLICIDAGESVPASAQAYSGLVFMGGPMSVNDDLPWIANSLALIRQAYALDIPLLGHCLGGQLISTALGAQVTRNPVKEIGWGAVTVADSSIAQLWFGAARTFDAFHWHGETFSLPPHAQPLLSSVHCVNQAYAIGKHLALQCHVEMTHTMIESWCQVGKDEIVASLASPAVQTISHIQQQTTSKLPLMRVIADHLYSRWLRGLQV